MSQGSLHLLLHATNRRWLFSRLARAVLVGFVILLGLLMTAVVLDGIVAFPRRLRIAVDFLLLGICLSGIGYLIYLVRKNRFEPRRVARMVEEQSGITDSALINAVDLQSASTTGSTQLLKQSIHAGESTAAHVDSRRIVSMRPVAKSLGWLTAALLVVAICCGVSPRFFFGGLMRFIDPNGNYPAFSLINFDVAVTPDEVIFGGPATITAQLAGDYLPDEADVVFLDDPSSGSKSPGNTQQRTPMSVRGENSYALELARVDEPRKFYVDTPKGRSKVFDLKVLMVPQFESITVAYHFPEYTGWPLVERSLTAQGIRAIVGTDTRVTVRSNLPLESGEFRIKPKAVESKGTETNDKESKVAAHTETTIKLIVDEQDPTLASAEFPLKFSGTGYFRITSTDGVATREPRETKVTAITDRAPLVDIIDPEPHLVVVEDWNVPVTIRAADDVGIARIELHPSINGWSNAAMDLAIDGEDRRSVMARHEFDLAQLGAQAGDIITYYASAFDNHPETPQFTDTDRYVIQVISQDDYVELARRRYRMQQLEEEIKGLREKLAKLEQKQADLAEKLKALEDKLASGDELTPEEQQQMAELQQQLADYAQQAAEIAEQMQERMDQPELYDVEKPYTDSLKDLANQLNEQSEAAEELRRQLEKLTREGATPEERKAAAEKMKQFREKMNKASDLENELQDNERDAEMMEQADQLLGAADRLRNVIMEQRDLADRMAEYRNLQKLTEDQQQRADQMAKQQELLRDELREATEQLREAAENAAEDLPKTAGDAQKLLEKLEKMDVSTDQQQASQSARKGAGREAHEAADSAAEKLESLLSECPNGQGAGSELSDCGLSIPKEGIGNTLDQLGQGRSLPGVKPGTGQTGRAGQKGSQGRYVVRGPHMPSEGSTDGATGRIAEERHRGRPGTGESWEGDPAESLVVEGASGSANAAGNLQGVPVGYRDQAEAYFERLAEEESQ